MICVKFQGSESKWHIIDFIDDEHYFFCAYCDTDKSRPIKDVLEMKVEQKTKRSREMAKTLEYQVQERNKELQQRVAELEKFHKLIIGRELRIIELKKENKKLKQESENIKLKNKSNKL